MELPVLYFVTHYFWISEPACANKKYRDTLHGSDCSFHNSFTITDVHEYICSTRIDRQGACGAEVEIVTMLHMLDTPIYIYKQETARWVVSTPNYNDLTRRAHQYVYCKGIYINHPCRHYDVVISVEFTTACQALIA